MHGQKDTAAFRANYTNFGKLFNTYLESLREHAEHRMNVYKDDRITAIRSILMSGIYGR